MKQLASIVGGLLLVLAVIVPVVTDSPPAALQIQGTPDDAGLTTLNGNELEAVAGAGDGADFACGAVSGAGLAVTLSGVGAPVGVGLALAGFICSIVF